MSLIRPQTQFRRRLTRAIALPIVLLLLLSGVSIWQITRLLAALRWVEHTNQVIAQANYTQKLLLDQETGLRGYLLTGQQNFLAPYEQANTVIEPNLEQLRKLVADNPSQVQRVDDLIQQAKQWEDYAPSAIARRQQGAPEPLSALERRKQRMDQIRQQIDRLIATEAQLRNQRSQMAQATTQSVILTSLLLALGVGAGLAYFLWRQILQVSQVYEAALDTAEERTAAAQQLAAALQQYKDIFQFAEHGLVVGAPDDQTLALMNPAFARMHGYTVEELLGMPILNLFPADCHAEAIQFIQTVNEQGYYAVESLHCRKDGTVFPVFLAGTAVRDAEGKLLYRIVSVHDISENKQAKIALQRSAQRLTTLHNIDRAILAAETDEMLINNALQQLRQIVPHQQSLVPLFDLETGTAQVFAGSSHVALSHPIGTQLTIADFAPELGLLQETRYVADLANAASLPPVLMQLRLQGFGSCVCLPLLVENRLIGELNLASTAVDAFDIEAQAIAGEVAAQLAIALHQSRLRRELQTTNQQLQRELRERQQAEQQLKESEERLRLFVKYAPVSVAMFDQEMRYVAVSQRWIDDYHLDSIASVLGKSHYQIFPNIPDYWRTVHQQGLAGQSQHCEEDRFVLPDGTEQYLRWEVQPWFDHSGAVNGILIFVEDITARKQIELALLESEQQFKATFNQAAVGIAHVAPDGSWLRVNQKLCEIVGYRHDELLQCAFQDITYAEDLDKDLDYMRRMLANEIQTYSMEKRYVRKDNSLVWINLTVSLVRDANEQPKYFISVIEDIQERKLAQLNQAFLIALDQQLRRFADAKAMAYEAVRQIGEYLQVDRSMWDRIDPLTEFATIEQDWRRQEEIPSNIGTYRISEYILPEMVEVLHQGQPVVITDVFTHPYTAPFAENLLRLNMRAFIGVPCIYEGRWVATLSVTSQSVRQWRADEVRLLQEAVVRLWSIISQTETIQALRDSEERIRLATEAAQLGMWFWDIAENQLVWTDRCKALFGLAPETPMSYEVFLNALHPDDRGRVDAAVSQALAQHSDYDIEFRVLWPDNSIRWIVARGRAYYDANNQPLHMMGTVQDITTRKHSEAALAQEKTASDLERKRLRAVLDILPVGVFIADGNGQIIEINAAARSIWGKAAPLPETIAEYREYKGWWPETNHRISSDEWTMARALREGRTILNEEVDIETFDGEHKTVLSSAIPIRDETGTIVNAVTVNVDITKRKQIEASLRRSAQRLETLQQIDRAILQATSATDIAHSALQRLNQVIAYQQAGIVLFNFDTNAAQVLAGQVDAAPTGSTLPITALSAVETLRHREAVYYIEDLSTMRSRPPVLEYQLTQGTRSVLMVALLVEGNLIGDLYLFAREPAGFDAESRAIAQEIANQLAVAIQQARLREQLQMYAMQLEQRVAERTAQLEETNQELEAFTYSVSHDLRAPLRTIQGFAAALLEDCGSQLDEYCRSYIDSIIDDAVQMNGLISDLLSYSRLTRIQINLQPIALEDVVAEAQRQLTAQIRERQAQIRIDAPLPEVMAHRSTLVQVVVNLISNAIKFMKSDIQPQIEIFTTTERQNNQDWIRLWIVDNGIGIAPEHQERVFHVFERLHGIESYPGTGIGLAIVRKGLERMSGRSGVESQLGQGSRFWIELPAVEQ